MFILICRECGQGDFHWQSAKSEMWCDTCQKITKWRAKKPLKSKQKLTKEKQLTLPLRRP